MEHYEHSQLESVKTKRGPFVAPLVDICKFVSDQKQRLISRSGCSEAEVCELAQYTSTGGKMVNFNNSL